MKERITKENLLTKVNKKLMSLPEKYVFIIEYRKSLGPGNVNIGQTKTELKIKVFDTDKEDWTHQPNVFSTVFEDSDGTVWWDYQWSAFTKEIERFKGI